VYVYLHVGLYRNTDIVVREILMALSLSGLLDEAVGVYTGISGLG
jgi:hypothetical protein